MPAQNSENMPFNATFSRGNLHEKMLLEWKDVFDFQSSIKEVYFRKIAKKSAKEIDQNL